MKEEIVEKLKKIKTPVSITEIDEMFNREEDLKAIIDAIKELEDEYLVYKTKKDKYILFENSNFKIGKLIVNKKGFGFVDTVEENDIYIHESNMNGAIHGDIVLVETIENNKSKEEGRIVRVVKRDLNQIVGEFFFKKGKCYVEPDDKKLKILINVDRSHIMGAVNGHKVLVKLLNQVEPGMYRGIIIKVLGHRNDPGVDILAVVHKYNLNDDFPRKVLKEIDKIPDDVLDSELKNRKDLRNEEIFTIDGDDTKDIDDAISFKKLDNGNYELGVHIADVSYYVRENTQLDKEALERGTSVYLADRVIPMLPHKLSNGICSLNPQVDRLAMSCVMEIDKNGKTVKEEIFESVINSKIQMTYKKVNKVLKGEEVEEYAPYKNTLLKMHELAHVLRKYKETRGYIDFDLKESKILVDDDGKAIDVVLRDRGEGEKMIEDFMIAANESVATVIYNMELPFVYRVHGKPSEEKIEAFANFIRVLGYEVDHKLLKKGMTPKGMQKVLESLKDKKEYSIFSKLLLRSMQKAIYDKNNIGHFGLASSCYTHFTSPIRRYPDTTVHRLLRKYLFEHKINNDTINFWNQNLVFITEHSSQKERDSIECEREVNDMKKAEYMMSHIGEKFEGTISSVMSFGAFIELDNLVEGLIRVEDIKSDFYTFDEKTFSLKGAKNKRGLRLGDRIKVIVKNASKEARTVDFILDEGEEDGDTE